MGGGPLTLLIKVYFLGSNLVTVLSLYSYSYFYLYLFPATINVFCVFVQSKPQPSIKSTLILCASEYVHAIITVKYKYIFLERAREKEERGSIGGGERERKERKEKKRGGSSPPSAHVARARGPGCCALTATVWPGGIGKGGAGHCRLPEDGGGARPPRRRRRRGDGVMVVE